MRWKNRCGCEVEEEEEDTGVFVCFIYLIKGWAGSGMGLGGLDWIGLDLMGLIFG